MRAFLRARRIVGVTALSLVATAALFTVGVTSATAAGTDRFVATSGDDFPNKSSNDCTVQATPCATISHAVVEASAGDTIHVGGGTYHEHVIIAKNVVIVGAGVDQTTVTGTDSSSSSSNLCLTRNGPTILIDGANAAVSVTLKDISVDGNDASTGIVVCDADLHLVDGSASKNAREGVTVISRVRAASATLTGSEAKSNVLIGVHGLFQSQPTVTAADVTQAVTLTLSHSDASENGRAGVQAENSSVIAVDHSTVNRNHSGGVVADDSVSATVQTSTLDRNLGAGAVAFGSAASLHLETSTVSNTKPFASKSTETFGSGVLSLFAATDVTNSTIVGNTGQGVLDVGGVVTVSQSTVTGTHAASTDTVPSGGLVLATLPQGLRGSALAPRSALTKAAAPPTPSLTVSGTITANQDAKIHDCAGNITDGGYNLSSDDSCKFSAAKHDLASTDPMLGALADNGGPTQTEKPLKGSPAIDAVDADQAGCSADAKDQRGVARPQPTGGKCDIGAVELAAKAIVISPDTLPHGTVGKAYSQQLTATGGQYPSYAFSLASGSSLPPGLSLSSAGKISGTPTKAGTFTFTVSVNDPVLKTYTIVIDAAAISNTGSHTGSMLAVGSGAILAGLLMVIGAGFVGRRPSGPRIVRRPIG